MDLAEETPNQTFLGFDWSTQKLKAIVVGEDLGIQHEAEVDFDQDLPEFRTSGGVLRLEAGEVVAPPLMWVKALDMLLDRLVLAGTDFSRVASLSGAAQQHGSVWWIKGSEAVLSHMEPDRFLHDALAAAFAAPSPVWLDTSTTEDCRALEMAVGGPEVLARVTGSRAYERFTGAQIRRIHRLRPRVYQATERISLVSSFACSLFLGRIAPLDLSDASGMNLLDINSKSWYQPALKECGDETLPNKLGSPVPSDTIVGTVSNYFVKRFGFRPDCKVVAFTGDNCSALAGLRLEAGSVGVSLGTSDTLLLGLDHAQAPPAGHVLLGPTKAAPYMALLCFSNGSLTRQAMRDRIAEHSWDKFNEILDETVRGNQGYIGIYYDVDEIVPRVSAGRWLWDSKNSLVSRVLKHVEPRALLEGQTLARRAHAEDMGFTLGKGARLIATGGASANKALLQIYADVFNAPVFVQDVHGNAAVLGAVVRASDAWSAAVGVKLPECQAGLVAAATPYADAPATYEPALARYRKLLHTLPALH